jgi:recombination protein RecT
MFRNAMAEHADSFLASVIDLYNNDKNLQACAPNEVIMEAFKAATLKLPINKQLGFAYILPYQDRKLNKTVPTFLLG